MAGCDVTVVAAFPHYPYGNIPKQYRWKPFKVEFQDGIRVIRTQIPPLRSQGLLFRLILINSFAISALFPIFMIKHIDGIFASSWIPGILYGKIKGASVAINVDDLDLEDIEDLHLLKSSSIIMKFANILYKTLYNTANYVVPISPGYTDIIHRKYGVKKEKIHLIRGGVDLDTFKVEPMPPRNKFRVLYSGAFSVAYDFDMILNAAKLIQNQVNDVEFMIQGGGELGIKINSTISKLNLKNTVFIDKILQRDAVSKLLNDSDLLLLPLADFNGKYLGMPSKLYEYQAVGKPILCCANGIPAEYVHKTKSGVIIRSGDYRSLAENILFLKMNSEVTKKLGNNGRCYVENNVSLRAIGTHMLSLFMHNCL